MALCPRCGRRFESSEETGELCPQCDAQLRSELEPVRHPERLLALLHSPTIVLIALNTLVFLLMVVQSRSIFSFRSAQLLQWGANSGALTSGGEWWRLLSSTFLHGGLLHIAFNMWCLYSLGWLAELLFGRVNYLLLYLMCGIGGSLASICWRGNGLSVGASGAIFGIAGALIPAMVFHGNRELRRALKSQLGALMLFVFYNLAFGAAVAGIDNAAHIGGLLTGLALGVVFPTGPERSRGEGQLRVAGSTLVVLAVFFAAGSVARHRNAGYIEIDAASTAFDRGNMEQAIRHARRAADLRPNDAHAQFMLGTFLVSQNRYAEAAEPLITTTRLRPDFGPAYVNLCAAQLAQRELTTALANCEKGVKLAPSDAVSWFNLGRVRYAMQDELGARDALAKAVSLNPDGFDENLHYGLLLVSTGEADKALPYLKKARNLRPDDEELNAMLQKILGRRQSKPGGSPQP